MNVVSLVGTLTADPALRVNRAGHDECRMRLAVPRYTRSGQREPGVVYVDVTTFDQDARDCADRLAQGSRVGLSGRLDDDSPERGIGVLIDQLDLL